MKGVNHLFTHDLGGLESSLDTRQTKAAETETVDTLSHLQSLGDSLPLLQGILSDDLVSELAPTADRLQKFDDIIVLGTGGSSLGGQTLLALKKLNSRGNTQSKGPRFHFLDNIDPHTFDALLPTLNPTKTAVIAISKSGNTAETLMQFLICLQHWSQTLPKDAVKNHFLVISEPANNGIRQLAKSYDIPCLDHPTDIGGRFAVFTVVGMLPAMIAGLDVKAIRDGARTILSHNLAATHPNECQSLQAALVLLKLTQSGVTQTVLMPYVDRLNTFTLWFRQLWAESLGKKDGNNTAQGITPIQALGTVDQHSQLQLYLDGPRDKWFTIITLDHSDDSQTIDISPIGHPAVDLFQGKTMGNLMMAEQKATIDTLRRHQCPTRVLHLSKLDEKTLGGLMMHFILETLAMAHLLRVNPFDQPAVEEGKILTQRYLVNAA